MSKNCNKGLEVVGGMTLITLTVAALVLAVDVVTTTYKTERAVERLGLEVQSLRYKVALDYATGDELSKLMGRVSKLENK